MLFVCGCKENQTTPATTTSPLLYSTAPTRRGGFIFPSSRPTSGRRECRGIGRWGSRRAMESWCNNNCKVPAVCKNGYCSCSPWLTIKINFYHLKMVLFYPDIIWSRNFFFRSNFYLGILPYIMYIKWNNNKKNIIEINAIISLYLVCRIWKFSGLSIYDVGLKCTKQVLTTQNSP